MNRSLRLADGRRPFPCHKAGIAALRCCIPEDIPMPNRSIAACAFSVCAVGTYLSCAIPKPEDF